MLKWTTKPPTEPGHYWVRDNKAKINLIVFVSTRNRIFAGFSLLTMEEARSRFDEWAGPIPEPVEE